MDHDAEKSSEARPAKGRVLLVEDDFTLVRAYERILEAAGFHVSVAFDAQAAVKCLDENEVSVIVSDIGLPGVDGIELLRLVRQKDLDVPVVLVTGDPAVGTAVRALEYGAYRYLTKPVTHQQLCDVVEAAALVHKMAKLRRRALELYGDVGKQVGDRAGLEASFERAMTSLWVAFQPIVSLAEGTPTIFGYEALLRSSEPTLPHPGAVLDAAERLDRLHDVGRAVRSTAGRAMAGEPTRGLLFVNLHARDLEDASLFSADAPLTKIADRVILEITERASLEGIKDVHRKIGDLRAAGFRIAIDDLGAGYAGLTSLAQLEPEVVKLDMSLVRNVHKEPTKRKLIKSMTALCRDMGRLVVAEGIESAEERDALVDLGCDLYQGFFFARPDRGFPEP